VTYVESARQRWSGCGLLMAACCCACLLLLANRIVVLSLYAMVVPTAWNYPRLRALLQLFLITGLLIPEWWLWDRAVRAVGRWLRHRRHGRS